MSLNLFDQLEAYHKNIPHVPRDLVRAKTETLELLKWIKSSDKGMKVRPLSGITGLTCSRIRMLLPLAEDEGYVTRIIMSTNASVWFISSRGIQFLKDNSDEGNSCNLS